MRQQHDGASVVGVVDPGPNRSTESAITDRGYNFPNSRKVYVSGKLHSDIRIPFREISLAPTKSMNGHVEVNEPVPVYDTSGPWGDPDFHGDPTQGLPPLRAKWIRDRGDVQEIDGRKVRAIDDGFLSGVHAAHANGKRPTLNVQRSTFNGAGAPSRRKPLRARNGCAVTQLAYARRGIITPEMEFIAIRENMGSAGASRVGSRPGGAPAPPNGSSIARNDLRF